MWKEKISEKFYQRMKKQLSSFDKSNGIAVPDKDSPIELYENANLNMVLWGDPQISCMSPIRTANFTAACRDLKNMKGKLDALLLVGDIAEYGAKCEYRTVSEILNDVSDKFKEFVCISGNHDVRVRNYRKQLHRFNEFISSVKSSGKESNEHYYCSREINGYKFILMGTDRSSFEGAYISKEQLDWLDKEIASVQGSGKPVFVLNHQTLHNTNGLPNSWIGKGKWRGSVGWDSDKIKAVFDKYENIIFITGHLHFGTCEFNYEDHGSFKALAAQTVGVYNHGVYKKPSQGYLISVYDDKIIARARLFGEGKYVESERPNSTVEIKIKK